MLVADNLMSASRAVAWASLFSGSATARAGRLLLCERILRPIPGEGLKTRAPLLVPFKLDFFNQYPFGGQLASMA